MAKLKPSRGSTSKVDVEDKEEQGDLLYLNAAQNGESASAEKDFIQRKIEK